ncbi:Serine hydroxymethyltransferase, cytosolic [Coemansia thaxteri]|uniref:Serine hydroxymethyltransferase n=1 Tax=Coemansia thaxteri TaxID=2663907 RepID=A0A9W8EF34_9FUNG|nr:Serine hydroxymethyltransferase, cytosolic [Coemansia thaxteri]KAJ2006739.1 Serine hydroxymethyltransferase, cytosolic [Coemansia thaxteri]KAJ2469315.1 Serine hydroxymethyltransferase, cytosolic [Coemansia sp. RSA 2322]KAJ2484106.1 Serine hydroxymethyltransferase, cytosolic [Coemansia sp. RSA 2320]
MIHSSAIQRSLLRAPAVRQLARTYKVSTQSVLNQPLAEADSEMFRIIELEKARQRSGICLIPSENFTSRAVMDALGSVMQNKYSEGYPGARYYGGNEYIDQSEELCQTRALETFGLDAERWGVNVQALSGAPANLYVYGAVLKPHDRLMGLDLPHGGHLSHGFQTPTKRVSYSSVYFETLPYQCNEETGLIDYDALEKSARLFRPKLIVAGASAYARSIDYARMRRIADSVGAYLMADMAHISGLVAAGVVESPFAHADIVTTTTHKSLRGPRGAMIFFRRGVRSVNKRGVETLYDLERAINQSVFPGHQGGPHNHTIAALAVALKQAQAPEFKKYQEQVLSNAQAFASALVDRKYQLVTNGTDTHLLLVNLIKSRGVDGARVERVLELAKIAANKNTVPGDRSAMVPGGLRLGTPAMTTRGLVEGDFAHIAEFVDRAVQIAVDAGKQVSSTKFADFKAALGDDVDAVPKLAALRNEVVDFARSFPAVGFSVDAMKYKQ